MSATTILAISVACVVAFCILLFGLVWLIDRQCDGAGGDEGL